MQTAAHDAWNALLRQDPDRRRRRADAADGFYTAMYHALLHPNVFCDDNGQYMGFDGQIHKAPNGHAEYANYSGWDIYRSQVQLAGDGRAAADQ